MTGGGAGTTDGGGKAASNASGGGPAGARLLRFEALLQRSGWLAPAYVTVDAQGCLLAVHETPPAGTPVSEEIPGYVIPGFQNAHSHAFQYAMAGLAEWLPQAAVQDDFWSWRDAMYRLAGRVSPEDVQAIAAMLYAEMVRHGITAVAEFHYLHHDAGGKRYANQAEMGQRLMAAATDAGIQLTLVPVLYRQGGFGKAATAGQARFLSESLEDYARLIEATEAAAKSYTDVSVGIGVHSLRAVAPEDVKALLGGAQQRPVHIHVAEQRREVDECVAYLKRRPVQWLLENASIDRRFSLVHATHLAEDEVRGLIATDATVVLCPSTEGNLGDGFFPLRDFVCAGGTYAIGTDSHVTLSPFEDLRWLDYGQRLRDEKRNVLCRQAGDDSGRLALDAAWTRGRASLGLPAREYFDIGAAFDGVVLDAAHPVLAGKPLARVTAAAVYAGDAGCLLGTLRRGEWVVQEGRHRQGAELKREYAKTARKVLKE